tara:strand:- start:396 stop:1163 length:768 start_codon:yes stop_codon:yes gene_type:complete
MMADMSLLSSNNYLSELTETPEDLVYAFEELVGKTILCNITENNEQIGCAANLIMGIYSIMHVFRIVLLYTRSRQLAIHHASRAGIYFLEFVSQISDDGQHYLQLTPKDAILFAYKKTLFDINTEYRSKFVATEQQVAIMTPCMAIINVSVRLRCYELDDAVRSHTKLDIVTLNRRHRGVYHSLLVCSQPNVESMGDLLDVMIADKVQPTICRGLLIALARRLKKKGGSLDYSRFHALSVHRQINVTKVAAMLVI